MNVNTLKRQLIRDEGVRYEVYKDHLGNPTLGIGHLITNKDPEYGLPVGTPVTKERVDRAFLKDVEWVLADCHRLYDGFDELPENAQLVLANMMFNMGLTRLYKFVKMGEAIHSRDWSAAAKEMLDSRWAKQVGDRSRRLALLILELV